MHVVEEVARKILAELMKKDTDTHIFQMAHASGAPIFNIVFMSREEFAKLEAGGPTKPMAEYGFEGRYVHLRESEIEGSPPIVLALNDKVLLEDKVNFRLLGGNGDVAVEGLTKYVYEFLTANIYPSESDALLH